MSYILWNDTEIASTTLEYSVEDGETWGLAKVYGPIRLGSYNQKYIAEFMLRDGGEFISLR